MTGPDWLYSAIFIIFAQEFRRGRQVSSSFLHHSKTLQPMIDSKQLRDFIEKQLEGSDYFFVDLKISPANEITVTIDSLENADLEKCVELTRAIEEEFPREPEDYELEVGTAGLTAPFKVRGQYLKNIGNEVEVLTKEGKKIRGTLTEALEDGFTVESLEKVKKEGEKRPVTETVTRKFGYNDVKSVTYLLKF